MQARIAPAFRASLLGFHDAVAAKLEIHHVRIDVAVETVLHAHDAFDDVGYGRGDKTRPVTFILGATARTNFASRSLSRRSG
jgi:hypothetical protein